MWLRREIRTWAVSTLDGQSSLPWTNHDMLTLLVNRHILRVLSCENSSWFVLHGQACIRDNKNMKNLEKMKSWENIWKFQSMIKHDQNESSENDHWKHLKTILNKTATSPSCKALRPGPCLGLLVITLFSSVRAYFLTDGRNGNIQMNLGKCGFFLINPSQLDSFLTFLFSLC